MDSSKLELLKSLLTFSFLFAGMIGIALGSITLIALLLSLLF